jgi:hypothetical protein
MCDTMLQISSEYLCSFWITVNYLIILRTCIKINMSILFLFTQKKKVLFFLLLNNSCINEKRNETTKHRAHPTGEKPKQGLKRG